MPETLPTKAGAGTAPHESTMDAVSAPPESVRAVYLVPDCAHELSLITESADTTFAKLTTVPVLISITVSDNGDVDRTYS